MAEASNDVLQIKLSLWRQSLNDRRKVEGLRENASRGMRLEISIDEPIEWHARAAIADVWHKWGGGTIDFLDQVAG